MRSTEDDATLSSDERRLVTDFAPAFVYPIFGQEETIFGYRELEINVRRRAAHLVALAERAL